MDLRLYFCVTKYGKLYSKFYSQFYSFFNKYPNFIINFSTVELLYGLLLEKKTASEYFLIEVADLKPTT